VTVAYVRDVRRRHRRAEGIVLYDRHLLDALVTLDFAYEGVDLRLHHGVVRTLLPQAALSFYLDVPADLAVARKPGDLFGRHAVERQLEGYAGRRNGISGLEVLDATRPEEELARTVLLRILGTTTEP
jgi:thymidylate kinase